MSGDPPADPCSKGYECLDHVLVYGRRHLDRVLRTCIVHYPAERPHRGLHVAVPSDRIVVLEGQQHVADILFPEVFAEHVVAFLRDQR